MTFNGRVLTAIVACATVLMGSPEARGQAVLESITVDLPGGVPLHLTRIPSGAFMMGQRPGDQDAYPNKETPQHGVTLTLGFSLGTHEVTKEQWQAVMGTRPWSGRDLANEDPKSPAVYISWNEANAFVTKLAELTGKPFRLPTEAEWEYACRANTATRFYWGDDPTYTEIDAHAWWRGNTLLSKEPYTRPVGTMPPNPWGLYDMSGNVSEWCADWHGYYPKDAVTDPTGPAHADHRVLRGGSWISIGGHCRSSRRHHETPETAHSDFGLRVALGGDGPTPGAPVFTDVFVCGKEGINTYRIPSLLLAPDGSLLAFCEARKERIDDASPTDMIVRRSLDGGRTWLPLQVLVAGKGNDALMNPCPVVDRTNNRILLYCMDANKLGPGRNRSLLLTSDDNGVTWSQPIDLASRTKNFDDSFVSGPGVGIQLRSGRLVIPGYAGTLSDELEEHLFSRVMYSDDHGETWVLGPPVDAPSDESQCVELDDGTLMLNMRGNLGMSCRGVALSKDGGESWEKVYWDRALNEAPCEAAILRYSLAETDGMDRILFSNPDNFGERFNVVERTRMTVRLSCDEGKTWPAHKLIYPGPSSYSTMVRLPDGDIGLLFEGGVKHRREWIRFVRFSLSWLTDGADAGTASPSR